MKDENGKRRPYYITLANGEPMAFAGLYSNWMGPNGEEQDTAAIVTVEPNLEISSIYDRMPAILRGQDDRGLAQHGRGRRAGSRVSGQAARAGRR